MTTEKKDISQYLHYYKKATFMAIPQHSLDRQPEEAYIKTFYSKGTEIEMIGIDGGPAWFSFYADIKPLLYRLEDITTDHLIEFKDICHLEHEDLDCLRLQKHGEFPASFGTAHLTSIDQWVKGVDYLRQKGYWLGSNDWFDEGLIIDKKTLK